MKGWRKSLPISVPAVSSSFPNIGDGLIGVWPRRPRCIGNFNQFYQFSFQEGAKAYEVFDKKLDNCIKAILLTLV